MCRFSQNDMFGAQINPTPDLTLTLPNPTLSHIPLGGSRSALEVGRGSPAAIDFTCKSENLARTCNKTPGGGDGGRAPCIHAGLSNHVHSSSRPAVCPDDHTIYT